MYIFLCKKKKNRFKEKRWTRKKAIQEKNPDPLHFTDTGCITLRTYVIYIYIYMCISKRIGNIAIIWPYFFPFQQSCFIRSSKSVSDYHVWSLMECYYLYKMLCLYICCILCLERKKLKHFCISVLYTYNIIHTHIWERE